MAQSVDTPYTLALLSEYTNTLETLPIDLSRNLADLRELDALLSSSFISITAKIHNLTSMIEQGTATKEDRLFGYSLIFQRKPIASDLGERTRFVLPLKLRIT